MVKVWLELGKLVKVRERSWFQLIKELIPGWWWDSFLHANIHYTTTKSSLLLSTSLQIGYITFHFGTVCKLLAAESSIMDIIP